MKIAAKIAGVAFCALALSQGLGAVEVSGSIQTGIGMYWNSTDIVAPQYQTLEGKVSGKVGSEDAPTAQYLGSVDFKYDPAAATTRLELGETWIKLFAGPFDLSFGNEIVSWSVSDAVWPSDVVNPYDLSLPVDPEKVASPMARAEVSVGPLSLDVVAQPFWVGSTLPGARWLPADESALASLAHNSSADETPAFSWENTGLGGHAKLSLDFLQGLDFGLTCHRGYSPTPTGIALAYSGYYPTGYHYVYDRSTYLGADLSLSPGAGFLLKTEWGYTNLDDNDVFAPVAGKTSLEGVGGVEYTVGTIQLEAEYVFDWAKGSPDDTYRHRAVGILTWSVDDRADLKLAGIYDFSDSGSFVASAQGSYRLADGLSLTGAVYAFFGADDTSYGSYADNSQGRVGLKYSF